MSKLIKFENPGCVPCKNMGDYLDSKQVKYDIISPYADPDSAMNYKIRTVPVLIKVDENGEELGRTTGFKPSEIDELIK